MKLRLSTVERDDVGGEGGPEKKKGAGGEVGSAKLACWQLLSTDFLRSLAIKTE